MPDCRLTRRQRQAAATRRDILNAARRLFAERGYAGTSIADIAAAADTAIQTIYSSVGPKPALVMALLDLIDEEAEVPALARQLGQATDPGELIRIGVLLTRQLNERCADLVGLLLTAAPSEPAVAEALREGMRRHHGGFRRIAARLDEFGALRPGESPERVGDVMALLTSPESYRLLTQGYGWSFVECETWLNGALATLFLRQLVEP